MTSADRERLTMLVEECAEVIHACTKILRHGYDSYHPATNVNNLLNLEREITEVRAVLLRMATCGDIELSDDNQLALVWRRKRRYTHYQP
jgi:NTP pyrophosphatase (non-canonical NTP hydrolase)